MNSQLTVRNSPKGPVIEGMGAIYFDGSPGSQYRSKIYPVAERIQPGAFKQEVIDRSDIKITFDHQKILGRTGNGTGRVRATDKGLWFEVAINQRDQEAMDISAQVERGDIDEASFHFDDEIVERFDEDGITIRSISHFGSLMDVGPVSDAAYKGTAVSVRSRDMIEAQFAIFAQNHQNIESRIRRFKFRKLTHGDH